MVDETIVVTKNEARAMLAALDWCEAQFTLGAHQVAFRAKLVAVWPDLADPVDEEALTLTG